MIKLFASAATALFLWLGALILPGWAGGLFYDDFEDGNATDGSPVKWAPLSALSDGTYTVENGDYVLRPNSPQLPIVAWAPDVSLQDVSLRTQVRVEGTADGIALFARAAEGDHTYQGGIDTAGDVYIGWNDSSTKYHNLGDVVTGLRPNQEDVSLQFDVVGNVLKLYAWRTGDPMPALPTVEVTDDQFSDPGNIGLLYDPTSAGSGLFRFVESAPVPEPSGLMLAGLAAAGMAVGARRRYRAVRYEPSRDALTPPPGR